MEVTVRFMGVFRSISGQDKFNLRFEESILVEEIVKRIIKDLPELEKIIVDAELESLSPYTLILVNGKEISVLEGLKTRLKEGDDVVLIPVIHGG